MQLSYILNRGVVLSVLLAVFGVFFIGCDSGGGGDGGAVGEDLNTTEAQTQIQNTDTDFAADINELTGGEFALTVQELFFGSSGSGTTANSKSGPLGFVLLDALEEDGIIGTSNDQLNYQEGEYDWDGSAWNKSSDSDDLVLNFPTGSGLNNNATFTLAEYAEVEALIDGTQGFLPTAIDASLEVGGTEIFSIVLTDTEFYDADLNGTQVPRAFLLNVLTAPQKHTFKLNSASKREGEFSYELVRAANESRVFGLLIETTLTEDFDVATGADAVETVTGELGLGPDLDIEYMVDVAGAYSLGDNPSVQQVNDQFTAVVRYKGGKAGTIEWGEIGVNGQSVETALFVYNDGSKVVLGEAFASTVSVSGNSAAGMAFKLKSAVTSVRKAVAKVF